MKRIQKWKLGFLVAPILALGMMSIWSAPAQATIFNFSDEYYVSSQAEFNTLFGTGTTGYSTAGIYQEVNTTGPTVYQLSAATGFSAIPGEFVQNTNTGIVLTNWYAQRSFFTNGEAVMTQARFTGGTSPYLVNNYPGAETIQYKTGITSQTMSNGTAAAFDLNSIDLRTISGATGYTITGLLGGVVKDTAVMATNGLQNGVNGSGYIYGATVTFNWTDIDTVSFTAINPAGTLEIDNININTTPTVVPVPPSLLLLGSGLVGLVGIRRRFKKA
ncbi:MAG TPA: hypothetical protein VKF36_07810 [Syntrophorhabdales bacterium]|nr:hypothetical protein [Syntrophorhabdales bacterium]